MFFLGNSFPQVAGSTFDSLSFHLISQDREPQGTLVPLGDGVIFVSNNGYPRVMNGGLVASGLVLLGAQLRGWRKIRWDSDSIGRSTVKLIHLFLKDISMGEKSVFGDLNPGGWTGVTIHGRGWRVWG